MSKGSGIKDFFGIDQEEYDKWRGRDPMLPTGAKALAADQGVVMSGTAIKMIHELSKESKGVWSVFDEPVSSKESCEHEPIDVGFMKTKMVCRKCDKNL